MKDPPRSRKRARFQGWASLAMAGLAIIALAITVVVAHRALRASSRIVVRGEGEALLAKVQADLQSGGVLEDRALASIVDAHSAEGLRYAAILDGTNGATVASAGTPTIAAHDIEPAAMHVSGGRVRLVALLTPKKDGPPGPRADGAPLPPLFREGVLTPPLVVIEFDTPVASELRGHMRRLVLVAAGAAAILAAFAFAWSRNLRRLAVIEAAHERERRLVALGEMSSIMAHELRNPLASLKGHAQLLAESLEGEEKKHKKAARVVSDAERLESLTESLLEFVRDGPVERRSVAPRELVAAAAAQLRADAPLKVDTEGAPETVAVDPTRVTRALQNLFENAMRAGEGQPVDVTIAKDGGDVRFEVRDRGAGIPPGDIARIFEPFMTTSARGTGLGLPIARRVAEQHGGSLTAYNHPAGGAVFCLKLPAAS